MRAREDRESLEFILQESKIIIRRGNQKKKREQIRQEPVGIPIVPHKDENFL